VFTAGFSDCCARLTFWITAAQHRYKKSQMTEEGGRLLIEGLSRVPLVFEHAADETEPLYYLPRLVAFSLIVVAVILKNRPSGR